MDDIDMEILKAVADSAEFNLKTIEANTDIPKSTIHYRVNKLKQNGVINGEIYDIDLEEFGLKITIISEVMAHYGESYHQMVGEKLSDIEGVSQVYFTMGDTDFIVIAHLPNRESVERLIEDYEAIEEVERTSSKFVISTIKHEQNLLRNYALDSLKSFEEPTT